MKRILHISFILVATLFFEQQSRSEIVNWNSRTDLEFNAFSGSSFQYANAEDDADAKFTLFVNQGILNIKYTNPQELEDGEAIVFNMLGQVITRKKLENSPLNQIFLPNRNTCYIIRISYSGKIYTKKIILPGN